MFTVYLQHGCVVSLAYPEVSNPHWIFTFFNCVFAKYTVQALLLYSFNPLIFQRENVENCTLISHFASAGLCPGTPHRGTSVTQSPGSAPHHVTPLHCKILATPMRGFWLSVSIRLNKIFPVITHQHSPAQDFKHTQWRIQRKRGSAGGRPLSASKFFVSHFFRGKNYVH